MKDIRYKSIHKFAQQFKLVPSTCYRFLDGDKDYSIVIDDRRFVLVAKQQELAKLIKARKPGNPNWKGSK